MPCTPWSNPPPEVRKEKGACAVLSLEQGRGVQGLHLSVVEELLLAKVVLEEHFHKRILLLQADALGPAYEPVGVEGVASHAPHGVLEADIIKDLREQRVP